MAPATLALVIEGTAPKGEVLAVSRTSELLADAAEQVVRLVVAVGGAHPSDQPSDPAKQDRPADPTLTC